MTEAARKFTVHARHADGRRAQEVSEASFEAAAAAYVEDLHLPNDEHEISVIVREIDTGREHCFRIDLNSGDTAPCR